jgi:hypothetical protein
MKVAVKDLKLGDVVSLFNDKSPYGNATVYRINPDGSAQVWRPYVTTADFSYVGGVIPYLGIEDFALYGGSDVERISEGKELR